MASRDWSSNQLIAGGAGGEQRATRCALTRPKSVRRESYQLTVMQPLPT